MIIIPNNLIYIYGLYDNEGLRYVGKAKDAEKRFKTHLTESYHGDKYYYPKSFWIRKHKEEIYSKIIAVCYENNWQEREKYWIAFYRKKVKLLNCTDGGDGGSGHKVSKETRELLSKKLKGRKLTPEHIAKRTQSVLGRKCSEVTKARISKANKGKTISKEQIEALSNANSIPILQYDLEGNFIKEWKSASAVSKFYNKGTSVTSVCRGTRKTALGYIWKYKDDTYVNR